MTLRNLAAQVYAQELIEMAKASKTPKDIAAIVEYIESIMEDAAEVGANELALSVANNGL